MSALDYKTSHKVRPLPLPKMDLPRSRSTEEAVTNILYNTPPPSLQPYNDHVVTYWDYFFIAWGRRNVSFRHVLNCLVQNEPGVLSRVSGILAGPRRRASASATRGPRAFSFLLPPSLSQKTSAQVPVWAMLDHTETRTISRELLVNVSILGSEYLEDQLEGGPSHEPRVAHRSHAEQQTKLDREMTLARHFEESNKRPSTPPLPPSEEGRERKAAHAERASAYAHAAHARVSLIDNMAMIEPGESVPQCVASWCPG
ncbi:hypothetical protein BJY52DRAFT_910144 [Lactarius psammicola]|nr:hypothetical protein BJY52DRAFT_910144 [Lactarius psammicola]